MEPEYGHDAMPSDETDSRIIMPPPPKHVYVAYFISIWVFKAIIKVALGTKRVFHGPPASQKPTLVKSYGVRPMLKNRVFLPPSPQPNEYFPLFLDVHGGGFAVGGPEDDDEFCSFLATQFRILVVALDYRKSPRNRFPCQVEDVASVVRAVIADSTLPIDTKKIVIGGFSAGGNLGFAVSQMEGLHGRINGVVGFYPALDLSEHIADKVLLSSQPKKTDSFARSLHFLNWGYVPGGVDRKNPLLSPIWAPRNALPKYAYLIGAENDILCREANIMAENLAGLERNKIGSKIPGVRRADGWQEGTIRWECIRDRSHAFTHVSQNGRKERVRQMVCKQLYIRVGEWLVEQVWATAAEP